MPQVLTPRLAFALITSLVYATGCSSDPPPAATYPQGNGFGPGAMPGQLGQAGAFGPGGRPQGFPNAGQARPDVATPTSGSIHIDDRIQRACGDLPTAHFAYDSSAVQPEASAALDALARCFTQGPLAGHGMLLTGHTDPRGELEYNMALGQRRAGNVASHLEERGVAKGHVTTSSHGELDATGTDESGWARDRKVDVALAE